MDRLDRMILTILQEDATVPVAEIGRRVGLSTTPCWRRIQKMEEDGVIKGRVAVLDPAKVNAKVTVFVSITTNQHNEDWLTRFSKIVSEFPEVVEFYRMSGQVDYLMKVVVPDIEAYDIFYQKLVVEDRHHERLVGLRHGPHQEHHRAAARLHAARPGGEAAELSVRAAIRLFAVAFAIRLFLRIPRTLHAVSLW